MLGTAKIVAHKLFIYSGILIACFNIILNMGRLRLSSYDSMRHIKYLDHKTSLDEPFSYAHICDMMHSVGLVCLISGLVLSILGIFLLPMKYKKYAVAGLVLNAISYIFWSVMT